jgi:FkbM family methyltransferase
MKTFKLFIYSLLDLLCLGKGIPRNINGIKIYFPARWSRYFEKDYEKENVAFLKSHLKPGMTVLDVGAHLGLMSVISSGILGPSGKVYAFEPSPFTFSQLKKVIALNAGHAPVKLFPYVVSKQNGLVDFFLSEDEGSNSNSMVEKHHQNRINIPIESVSIDQFVTEQNIHKVDLLKVDAEGSELDVLQGAEMTLRKLKPLVILAVHPRLIVNNNQSTGTIYQFIKQNNYRIFLGQKELSEKDFTSIQDFFDVHLIPERS